MQPEEPQHPNEEALPEREHPPIKIADVRYPYRGYYDRVPAGICRVRIFGKRIDELPVMIITELPENTTTSVTNMIEILAAELIAENMPERFEHPEPPIVIEHQLALPTEQGRRATYRRQDAYSWVTLTSWAPRKIWLGGQERLSFGPPAWRHMPVETVAKLVGKDEVGSWE